MSGTSASLYIKAKPLVVSLLMLGKMLKKQTVEELSGAMVRYIRINFLMGETLKESYMVKVD